MATVVYRRGHVSTADKCIARVSERSLSTLNTPDLNVDKLHRYVLIIKYCFIVFMHIVTVQINLISFKLILFSILVTDTSSLRSDLSHP